MQASIEFSLYPLSEDYDKLITDFLIELKRDNNIKVIVNGISTQIFGDYDYLLEKLKVRMKKVFEANEAIFVLKVAGKKLLPETLPEELK